MSLTLCSLYKTLDFNQNSKDDNTHQFDDNGEAHTVHQAELSQMGREGRVHSRVKRLLHELVVRICKG